MKVFSLSFPAVFTVLLGMALSSSAAFAEGGSNPAPTDEPIRPRAMVPLDRLIVTTRNKFADKTSDVVIQSARLHEENRQKVFVIDFIDAHQKLQRIVYDAFTGKEIDRAPMAAPMPMEEILTTVGDKYPGADRIRTWLERQGGSMVYVIELADRQFRVKRRQLTIDAYTGRVVRDEPYEMKPDGKQVSLEQIIKNARQKYRGMVVLRTRSGMKDNVKVREIIFLDGNRIRHKMVVNSVTGEVIEDRIAPPLV